MRIVKYSTVHKAVNFPTRTFYDRRG